MTKKLSKEHFHPYSLWTVDKAGPTYDNGKPKFIIDSRTGDKYLNESMFTIRVKCLLLSAGTLIVHSIAAVINMLFNFVKLITFYDFWKPMDKSEDNNSDYNLTQRCSDAQDTLIKLLFSPIAVLLLECAAIYGMIMPYDGRKLYASLERFTYGHFILAPCFQPDAEEHLLGGNINQQNAF